jgi:hypothetical protein
LGESQDKEDGGRCEKPLESWSVHVITSKRSYQNELTVYHKMDRMPHGINTAIATVFPDKIKYFLDRGMRLAQVMKLATTA